MHRTVQLIQTILLHIIVKDGSIASVRANIQSYFHLRIAAITNPLLTFLNLVDVIWQKGRFVEAASLIHAFFSRRVELNHHR